jgi:hypothetical protein
MLTIAAPLFAQAPAPPRGVPAPSAAAPVADDQAAQEKTPAAAPQAPPRAPSLSGPALAGVNIRLDITITDTYGGAPQKKTVALTVLSGQSGMVRTSNNFRVAGGFAQVKLNVDAQAMAYQSGAVSTRLTVSYMPAPQGGTQSVETPPPGTLEESIAVALMDGQPLVLTESADPASDRKVTLEVKATILK